MGRLYRAVCPLPSAESIPALRAYLETTLPLCRGYVDTLAGGLAGGSIPPRVAVSRLCGLSLLPPLLERAGISLTRLRLYRDEHGRPYGISLDPTAPAFDFNISHSNTYGACALLVGGGRVGIDVEDAIPPARAAALIRRYCTEGEKSLLDGLTNEEAAAAFTRIWTIREALGKQEGRGMPLRYDATRIPHGVTVDSQPVGSSGAWITVACPRGVMEV
jgi:phosphopantetheinyl transferase